MNISENREFLGGILLGSKESAFKKNSKQFKSNTNAFADGEYSAITGAIIRESKSGLVGIADLQSNGLVERLPSIGITVSRYVKAGGMNKASVSSDLSVGVTADRMTFEQGEVPVPVVAKHFKLTARELEASRLGIASLDTASVEEATFVVNDTMEDILFNGSDFSISGQKIEGYKSHAGRQNVSLTGNGWVASNGDIIKDVKTLLTAISSVKKYGNQLNCALYVANNIWVELQDDYSSSKGSATMYQRILAFDGISILKTSSKLADNEVVLVDMSRSTVDFVYARNLEVTEHRDQHGGYEFAVHTIGVPRVKSYYDGNAAVAYGVP